MRGPSLEARRRALGAVLGGAVALAGPAVAAGQPVVPVRTVVQGVVHFTHATDAFAKAPPLSLAPTPIGRAAGADAPEWDLTWVSGVVLRPDGRLVTLSPVGNRFFRFGPDGRGEKVLARQGAGPGEIMAPSGPVAARGDTVVVLDPANNRINWFDVMKGGVRTATLPRTPGVHRTDIVGVLRNGVFVGTSRTIGDHVADRVTRQPTPIMLLSPATGVLRVIDSIPGLELVGMRASYRGRASVETRMLRFTRVAQVQAWDTLIVTGSGEGYAFELRDAAGAVRARVRVPIARRAVTAAMRQAALAAALKRFDDPSSERMVDKAESLRLERATPTADSLPPYGGFHLSPDQRLWIVDARGPLDAGGAATAFRQDGAIVGRLTWKGSGSPVAFGTDRVVMKETDDDGVVSLAVYRLQRGGVAHAR